MNKLGFGLMRLPLVDENDRDKVDLETLNKMVDTFLERGFTYFDTAYMYHNGNSETALREAVVKRHPRESFTVADKLPIAFLAKKEDVPRTFEEQIERCGVDYFDYYLLHNLTVDNYRVAEEFDAFRFIQKQKAAGRIRKIGFSYHDNANLLDEILTAHPEIEFVQLQLNYLDWENESIQSRLCYEVARKHGKPIVVMEPVKGGFLANPPQPVIDLFAGHHPDWSPASWAIRFAAGLEGVETVLSGMTTPQQLLDNTDYMQNAKPLTEAEQAVVKEAMQLIQDSIAIGCTACEYCTETCPQNIAIPKYFALYNNQHLLGPVKGFSLPGLYYQNYTKTYGKASDCISCGLCEHHCPQQLKITDLLQSVAAQFENM